MQRWRDYRRRRKRSAACQSPRAASGAGIKQCHVPVYKHFLIGNVQEYEIHACRLQHIGVLAINPRIGVAVVAEVRLRPVRLAALPEAKNPSPRRCRRPGTAWCCPARAVPRRPSRGSKTVRHSGFHWGRPLSCCLRSCVPAHRSLSTWSSQFYAFPSAALPFSFSSLTCVNMTLSM